MIDILAVEFCRVSDRRRYEHVYVNGQLRLVYVWEPGRGWIEPIRLLRARDLRC